MAKKSVRETNDREEIESLEKQTDKVIYILLDTLFIPPHYKFISEMLLPKIWMNNAKFCKNMISEETDVNWSETELMRSINHGEPTERVSDLCVSDIITSGSFETRHICNYDRKECGYNSHPDSKVAHGYPLTHRLLYWQVSKAFNCTPNFWESYIKYKICSQVYTEIKAIEKNDYPTYTHDLFIEQILLCGMEGYADFLKDQWFSKILSWQTEHGCFSMDLSREFTKSPRFRREANNIAYGCRNHITGLAGAVLMLKLRHMMAGESDPLTDKYCRYSGTYIKNNQDVIVH